MASNETGKQKGNNLLRLFLANIRSAKGKTSELQSLILNYDIICLTETHLDDTIPSSYVTQDRDKTVFRRDHTLCGGGILVAVTNSIKTKQVDIDTLGEEMIILKIEPKTIICCYYRPHVRLQNTENIRSILWAVNQKFPDHILLLIRDEFSGHRLEKRKYKTIYPI